MICDTLYINGNVLTMTTKSPVASAFVVVGERFRTVGTDEDVQGAAAPGNRVVDLWSRTVIPGFIETHCHLSLYAMTQLQADCRTPPNRFLHEVLERIRDKAEALAGRDNFCVNYLKGYRAGMLL